MSALEWAEYTLEPEPANRLVATVTVFEGRWCGHLTKLAVRETNYRKVTTLCGIFVAEASYIQNWSHSGFDWMGPETGAFGLYDPPDPYEPPRCKRCFRPGVVVSSP